MLIQAVDIPMTLCTYGLKKKGVQVRESSSVPYHDVHVRGLRKAVSLSGKYYEFGFSENIRCDVHGKRTEVTLYIKT